MVAAMYLAAGLAAFLHVAFFCAESILWMKPAVQKRFLMSEDQALSAKLLAFNQGFYNLYLAAGTALGMVLWALEYEIAGLTLIAWCCFSMVAAAVVLIISEPRLKQGAFVQAVPPLVFLILLLMRGF